MKIEELLGDEVTWTADEWVNLNPDKLLRRTAIVAARAAFERSLVEICGYSAMSGERLDNYREWLRKVAKELE